MGGVVDSVQIRLLYVQTQCWTQINKYESKSKQIIDKSKIFKPPFCWISTSQFLYIFIDTFQVFSRLFNLILQSWDTTHLRHFFSTQLTSEVVHKLLKMFKILLYFHNHQSILIRNKLSKYEEKNMRSRYTLDIY